MKNTRNLAEKGNVQLWDFMKPEFEHMKTNSTIGGALTDLGMLINRLQTFPHVNQVITQVEYQIAEENKVAFENLQKSVEWIQNKINLLLPYLSWGENSQELSHTNALLEFQVISLGPGGYLHDLLMNLKHVASEARKNVGTFLLFEGWAKIGQLGTGDLCIEEFHFPTFLQQEINKPSKEEQIYQWKEKTDTSLPVLYRFLKLLTLYPSFTPLTLGPDPSSWIPAKNLQEFEERQYQACIGFYLSLFQSSDTKKHPLTIDELSRLVKRFVFLLEKEVGLIDLGNEDKQSTNENWRTERRDEDVDSLIPFAKQCWERVIPNCKHLGRLGRKKLASDLLNELPSTISLHSQGKKRDPRALKALEVTDPRIYENGKCLGLKPHWQKFNWVKN